jgi:hypothetical protein
MSDALNKLFDAALEFGVNWRAPVMELASERLPQHSPTERAELAATIEDCRNSIEDHVRDSYDRNGGEWGEDESRATATWIKHTYPWMTEENVRHAISQSVYYAWHG